ncbi:MAG: hypothetical protein VX908_06445, partial [Planctomycetota bacterium]|nr:hypothetical protein [Planctomycetota bacterium]
TAQTAVPEGYIVIGWHKWAPLLLKELNDHLAPGSSLKVVYDSDYTRGPGDELLQSLNNIKITTQTAHTSRRVDLEKLDLGAIDEIVLLSYRDSLDRQSADSRTLLTLVHLREFVANSGRPIGIASELLDARNRALANRGREDDFIASEELVSNVMVQLSENPHLSLVLDELLTAAGSEMYLRSVDQYIEPNTRISFGAIVQAGLDRGDAVIGVLDRDPTRPLPDLRLSIDKNEEVLLGSEDAIVVVAKD